MAQYKDVEQFLKWIETEIAQFGEPNICLRPVAYGGEHALRAVLQAIKQLPCADVVEVKRGEWELKSEIRRFLEEIDEDFYVECPFCQRVYYVPFEFEDEKMLKYAKEKYPYCNCGAKMDGGKTE